jgi:hypothetical protein
LESLSSVSEDDDTDSRDVVTLSVWHTPLPTPEDTRRS